jgi:hypothetical protein
MAREKTVFCIVAFNWPWRSIACDPTRVRRGYHPNIGIMMNTRCFVFDRNGIQWTLNVSEIYVAIWHIYVGASLICWSGFTQKSISITTILWALRFENFILMKVVDRLISL